MAHDAKGAIEAAEHWERVAADEMARAEIETARGSNIDAFVVRAASYQNVARCLRLEAATGRPHCTICLKDHPNHLHMHQG